MSIRPLAVIVVVVARIPRFDRKRCHANIRHQHRRRDAQFFAFTSSVCGFPVYEHDVGTVTTMFTTLPDGSVKAHDVVVKITATFYSTDPAHTGTVTTRPSGPFIEIDHPDGSVTMMSIGQNGHVDHSRSRDRLGFIRHRQGRDLGKWRRYGVLARKHVGGPHRHLPPALAARISQSGDNSRTLAQPSVPPAHATVREHAGVVDAPKRCCQSLTRKVGRGKPPEHGGVG